MLLPTRTDLRHLLGPVRDQGRRGTCLAFAITAAHEAKRATITFHDTLCVEMLHWGSQQNNGFNFPSAALALSQTGQPLESAWPYDEHRDDTDTSYVPPDTAQDAADRRRATLTRSSADISVVKSLVHAQQSVLLNLQLCYGFHGCTDGVIALPTPQELLPGRHAVLVAGFDDEQGDGCFLIRNSWGEAWGTGGYAFLPYDYLLFPGVEAWIVGALL